MGIRRTILPVIVTLAAAACVGGGGDDRGGGTLVFGASTDPVTLDPAFTTDGESLRIVDQILEGLVAVDPEDLEIVPKLATSWRHSADGLAWTFELRRGVRFHDGTAFDAEAVCFNFERWYNFRGILQSPSVSFLWGTIFGEFSDQPGRGLYRSCEAEDADTVVIHLTRPSAPFLGSLSNEAFWMASPDALTSYGADEVSGTEEEPAFTGSYGLQQPTGTGPFKFESFRPNHRLVLVRNEDYWGEKATLERVIYRPIPDAAARRQALETGEIHAYDFPDPGDVEALRAAGFQVLERRPFNVGYVGLSQSNPPLDNLKIRQAIAHALNREALVRAKYPPGAEVATQFQPSTLFGWSPDVPDYDYDPAEARRLIGESGVRNPTLEFWYPSGVSRPYMPDPTANFQAFKSDLEEVGFTVVPKTAPWGSEYLDVVNAGEAPLFLIGLTGAFADPDDFIGFYFQEEIPRFSFDNPEIRAKLDEAEVELDLDRRAALYREANEMIMRFLPGVPYVHTPTFVALAPNVRGWRPSPVTYEPLTPVYLEPTGP